MSQSSALIMCKVNIYSKIFSKFFGIDIARKIAYMCIDLEYADIKNDIRKKVESIYIQKLKGTYYIKPDRYIIYLINNIDKEKNYRYKPYIFINLCKYIWDRMTPINYLQFYRVLINKINDLRYNNLELAEYLEAICPRPQINLFNDGARPRMNDRTYTPAMYARAWITQLIQ
jgi:hypothetical protein